MFLYIIEPFCHSLGYRLPRIAPYVIDIYKSPSYMSSRNVIHMCIVIKACQLYLDNSSTYLPNHKSIEIKDIVHFIIDQS